MFSGSAAVCCNSIKVMSVALFSSYVGSKMVNRGWNLHGTKFLLNSVSLVRLSALATILSVHAEL